ncbi:TadE/TadG family type IV pilus assembly protein [Actibacterium sp. MT2.3-13A]|uniref:TadE/TadG family type IV pilus assembly protein n=1 Tax=Actibacterium sp. MT2.3-13A TaxID=2828332 RepID=UPI001BACF721|nr:TadE/TadG family type IV pilus assembly protein [Actibacterium sp. MT2.3-13A]
MCIDASPQRGDTRRRGRLRRLATLRRFARREDGSLVIFGLFLLLIMLGITGMAVDVIRVETTRTRLQNTMDRAVLAAADIDNDLDAKAVVTDYFDKAGLGQYLGDVQVTSTTAADEVSYRRVSATAQAEVRTMFMRLSGIDTLTAASAATAEQGITDLEISLVLDVSGSMGSWTDGGTKIAKLREAAKDFSYYMQCNPNAARGSGKPCTVQAGKVSISMVPYAEQVTVGPTLLAQFNDPQLTLVDITDEHANSHCVTFDPEDFATADIMARNAQIPYWELKRTGHFDARSRWYDTTPDNRTCRTDSWREIRPFVGDHSEMEGYIDGLRAGGNTSIDIGMKWGTALLSPEMRQIVGKLTSTAGAGGAPVVDPDFLGRPYNYDQDYSIKVIVLMTDGVNTTQYYLKEPYRNGLSEVWRNTYYDDAFSVYDPGRGQYFYTKDGTWHDDPYGQGVDQITVTQRTCTRDKKWWRGVRCTDTTLTQTVDQPGSAVQMSYPEVWETFPTDWYAGFSWLANPVASRGNADKNGQLDAICTAAKRQGIIVYTIGFEVGGDADTVMAKCATSPGHYFPADGTNLAEVFGTIASSINQLRLTQ